MKKNIAVILFCYSTFVFPTQSCNRKPLINVVDNDAIKFLGGKFQFEEKTYDFGTVKDGDTVSHVFNFKNSGTGPIIIHDISTSCGCTVVEWQKNAIPPGGTGYITVQFSNHNDPGTHLKNIIIKANTEDPYTVINIKVIVTKSTSKNMSKL